MWPDHPIDYVKLTNDADGTHFGLFQNEKLVSVVSLFVDQHEAQFRKFATLADYQGHGIGTRLLKHVFDEALRLKLKRIWCNARVDKRGFYHRFGMTETDQTFTKGGIDYVVMERVFAGPIGA